MKNEIQLVEQIKLRGQLIKKPRIDEKPIFPLTPTHRKELRHLKDSNCGNLHTRLHTIRGIKKDEFNKKYEAKIEKELSYKVKSYENSIKKVREDYKKIFNKLTFLYDENHKLKFVFENDDFVKIIPTHYYRDIFEKFSYLKTHVILDNKELVSTKFEVDSFKRKILDDMFSKKFGESFKKCEEMISSLEQQYEEAINFGDLEQVKEIYYFMKDSEKFFENVSELKV